MERQIILDFCKNRMGKRHLVYVPERDKWQVIRLIGSRLDTKNEALVFECQGFVDDVYIVRAMDINTQVKCVW